MIKILHPFSLSLLLLVIMIGPARGEESSLEKLNQDVQKLYRESRRSQPMVQFPVPQWLRDVQAQRNPQFQLDHADPEMASEIRAMIARQSRGPEPVNRDQAPAERVPMMTLAGTIIDDQQHVILPVYLDLDCSDDAPIVVVVDNHRCTAKYLGSDRQTHLTILQLEKPLGSPARIAQSRPEEGELVVVHPSDGSAPRLLVWTGGRGVQGTVVKVSGETSGFCRAGNFFPLAAAMPIARQIIDGGAVRRAILGVQINEISKTDPVRFDNPALGDLPAVRIERIVPGSPAQLAGFHAGDFILQMAGQPVGELAVFATRISVQEGKTDFVVLRGEKKETISVDLIKK